MPLDISIAPELLGRVRLGVAVLDGVQVRERDAGLEAEIETSCRGLRETYAQTKSADVPGVAAARDLYKALGIDPTKTRPSNEALLRRVLKGEPLYRINTLVDALNLCSLRSQLPYGLYDLAGVEGRVVLRRGLPGESYEGIRKGPVHLDGRPTLADDRGAFGNPTSDSARTMVTTSTVRVLVAIYAPAFLTVAELGRILDDSAALLTRICGGQTSETKIL